MSVGGLNTFLSSWADHLETEMLHMSEFHTGNRISFFVLFVFFPFSHLKRFLPPLHHLWSIQPSTFLSMQEAGLGDRAIAQGSFRPSNEGTQTTSLSLHSC